LVYAEKDEQFQILKVVKFAKNGYTGLLDTEGARGADPAPSLPLAYWNIGNMKHPTFSFGAWQVFKASNSIQDGSVRRQLEPRMMDVLVALCEQAGTVLSAEELLQRCWGSTLHGDNPVHKSIAHLRKSLGDSAAAPVYIETIRKRGYRAIAAVSYDDQGAAWLDGSPFRGLEAFDAHHAAVFFGREEDSQRLFEAVLAQSRTPHCLVMVLGPSGSGKTSLIQAGLLPMLEQGVGGIGCASFTSLDLGLAAPGRLLIELGSALLDWQSGTEAVFDGESAQSLGRQLADRPEALVQQLASLQYQHGRRLLLFLDRFEALFALPSIGEEERAVLVRAIDVLAGSPHLIIIAACRNDFYPCIADYPPLMRGKASGAHLDITRPNAAQIARIIRLPAQAAQLRFGIDPDSGARLDDVLCNSVTGNPDALPLLQYTLQELYRQRNAHGELSFETFVQLGGVDGAIGRRADAVINALAPDQQAALPRVLALVVTVSSASDSVTSCSARWADLRDDDQRLLVGALVDARLLVSELIGSVARFRVAHEALLRRWPRATEWIAAHRNGLLIRTHINTSATRWHDAGKPADLLLPAGQQLDEARAIVAHGTLAVSDTDMAFVRVSYERARWRTRLRLAAMTLILLLATLATALGVAALGARNVAEQRRADAEGLVNFMLGELAEKLRPLGRLELLDRVSGKALTYLTKGNATEAGRSGALQRAKALHVIGEVRIARGDLGAATAAFTSAREVLVAQLAADPNDSEVLMTLGANAYWLGKIQLDKSDLKGARTYFLQYSDYGDRLFKLDPANVDTWIEQSYAHSNLGTLAFRMGDFQGAAREFTLSVELKTRALARKSGDRDLTAEIADSLSWVAEVRLQEGDLADALALYERELALVASLHAASAGDALMADRRSDALQHRAGLLVALGRDVAGMQDYGVAAQLIANNLVLEPGNRTWQRALVYVQLEQLRIRSRTGLSSADGATLADVLRRVSELSKLDPKNDDWARLMAIANTRYGTAMQELARYNDARSFFDHADAILAGQMARDRDNRRSLVALATNHLARAHLLGLMGDLPGERERCMAVREILQASAAQTGDYKVLDPWVRAARCLGQPEIATPAMRRLSAMGYRDVAYVQDFSNQKMKEPHGKREPSRQ